jgi:hypothetical protein
VQGVVFGDADAFAGVGRSQRIDDIYVDGVSVTVPRVPTMADPSAREHVLTLVGAHPDPTEIANQCPCEPGATPPPSFVGQNFICDRPTLAGARPGGGRAYDENNPVWDVDVCGAAADGYWSRTTETATTTSSCG